MLTPEEFSTIINIAIASRHIKSLQIPHMKLRTSIHIIIHGIMGQAKSNTLYQIAKPLEKHPVRGLTSAHLIGSVDKLTGIASTPLIWDCRNSVVLIDEYWTDKGDWKGRETLNTLLSLLENPTFTKKVAYRCNDLEEHDEELFCVIKNGAIKCHTRFVMIMTTMKDMITPQMEELKALKTRCVCLYVNMELSELEKVAQGEMVYKFKEIIPKQKEVKISKKKYTQILSYLKEKKIAKERYLRLVGDLCRVYAVLGKIDKRIFDLFISLEGRT